MWNMVKLSVEESPQYSFLFFFTSSASEILPTYVLFYRFSPDIYCMPHFTCIARSSNTFPVSFFGWKTARFEIHFTVLYAYQIPTTYHAMNFSLIVELIFLPTCFANPQPNNSNILPLMFYS